MKRGKFRRLAFSARLPGAAWAKIADEGLVIDARTCARGSAVLLAGLVAVAAHAEDVDRFTIGPPDCRVVNPRPAPDEDITWTGGCSAGMAEGDGALDWLSAGALTEHFVGHLHAGMPEGQGEARFRTGEHYVGSFRAGFYDGVGVLERKNGERVSGTFVHGEVDGEVEITRPDGTHFKGLVHNAMPDGPGRFDVGPGNAFEGTFHQGLPAGPGVLTRGGVVTRGNWLAWHLSGPATIEGPGRRRYEGMTADDRPDGQGALTLEDGSVYRGGFVQGVRAGDGTLTSADGKVRYAGGWRNDLYEGHGLFRWDDATWYEGDFRNGKRLGHGTLHVDGDTLVGEFDQDRDTFTGVRTDSDGTRVTGHWFHEACEGVMLLSLPEISMHQSFRAGVAEGPWDASLADGSHYSGDYHEGRLDGPIAVELPDGTRMRGTMNAGLRDGAWKVYDPGAVVRELRFEHGELVQGTPPAVWDPPPLIPGCSNGR